MGKASHSDAATGEARDRGTDWTVRCAARYGRLLLICDVSDPDAKQKIQDWLRQFPIKVLSVGGPAESTSAGIGGQTYRFLRAVFEDL